MNPDKRIAFSDVLRKSLALAVDNVGIFLQLAAILLCGMALTLLLLFLFFGFDGIRSVSAYSVSDMAASIRPEFLRVKSIVAGLVYGILIWSMFVIFVTGCLRIACDLVDDGKSSIRRLWIGDKKIIAFFGAGTLFMILFLVGLILGIIPGIFIGISCMFFGPIIIDSNMSAIGALKASFTLTRGNRLQLLYWIILMIILNRFFGLLIAPVFLIAQFVLYRALVAAKYG